MAHGYTRSLTSKVIGKHIIDQEGIPIKAVTSRRVYDDLIATIGKIVVPKHQLSQSTDEDI
jgi:uncharacterized protein YbjQ (UPF0145 family)